MPDDFQIRLAASLKADAQTVTDTPHQPDQILASGRRYRGRRRWATGVLAGVASVAVLVVATQVLPQRGIVAHPVATGDTQAMSSPGTSSSSPSNATPSGGTVADFGRRPTVGTVWTAENLFGPVTGTELARRPWLRLQPDGTVDGHDGCTMFSGRYQADADHLTFTDLRTECPTARAGQTLFDALSETSRYQRTITGLSLISADGGGLAAFHPLTLTEEPAPDQVLLRISNETQRRIATVEARLGDNSAVSFGPLQPGQVSDYKVSTGTAYRYAGITITYSDGTAHRQVPADFVGEEPLAPGRYTYVLAEPAPSVANPGGTPPYLDVGLEESGKPGR